MNSSKSGFTFIEMVVTIGVLTITLPALFSIIFSIMQQQTKIVRLSTIKREGDFILNTMKNTIRNRAYRLYSSSSGLELCDSSFTGTTSEDQIVFEDADSIRFSYSVDGITKKLMVFDPDPISKPLTTTFVYIQNLEINCSRTSSFSAPTIIISYDICFKGSLANCAAITRGEETASLHYQTYITLRNF